MPYLLLKKLNRIDENENKNLKPIAIVKSEKKDKDPLHNAFLYLDMDDKPNSKKKTKIELDFHQKFEILPNTNSDKRDVMYIAGASGSGKSYITKQIVNNYAKLYPKRKIFIVSRLDEDETLDGIKSKNIIKLDIPSLVETPFDVNNPLFYKSCFVLDDVDDLPDKHQQKAVQDMLNAVSIMGRLHKKKKDEEGKETGQGGISLFFLTHYISNFSKTRIILNESTHYVLYPQSTATNQLYYILSKYIGLERKDILNLKKMGSRWCCIHKNYPQYIVGQYSAKILHTD
eukprot:jgi/Bigna1/144266/aug1.85_g18974